ncbi:hypothetical protein FE257_008762 [Aspergillus nanangensis]|uniref:Uncharacterized protein n=1 Tax=Aspergillus nanangensis TaxID=2582783 RepID=A0AAD4GSC5_ASPNN|nr:hypothetical protein FE257_008762 [Aspergillus nanangensis]
MDAKNPPPPSTARSPVFDYGQQQQQEVYPMLTTSAPWPTAPVPLDLDPYNNTPSHTNYAPHAPPYPTPIPSTSPSSSAPNQPHVLPYVGDSDPQSESASQSTTVEPSRPDATKNGVSKMRKPRKANTGAGGRSTLFWVHTDPQSASEGTREETLKRIRSHVMSEHNRKKRMENTKRYNKGKTWKHLAFQPVETTASSSATISPSSSYKSPVKASSPESRITPDPPPSDSTFSSPEQVKHEHPEHALTVSDTRAPEYPEAVSTVSDSYSVSAPVHTHAVTPPQAMSPWTYVGTGANDPFNVLHTSLTDRMMRHLQYFLCDLTIQAYPLQRQYGNKLQSHWSSLIQRDPASLQACICVAATNCALSIGEFPLTTDSQRSSLLILDTFHHRGETIRLVNEGLSEPQKASSDELIAAVSILLTIEIASGNPDYLKVHLAGLRQMVSMRNSFADVPHHVRFQISWTDIRVACMSLSKPIFPFVRYARPPNLTIMPPHNDFAHTASRLISLVKIPGIFGDVMSKTIFDLLELVWYSEWFKGGIQEFDEETEGYFNTEVLYVEYILHTDRYTETGEPKGDASIEGCVRLACLVFHNSVIWDFYPQIAPVFPKPIIALREALETTIPAGYFNMCEDVLIWVLFIASCSSGLLPDRVFFVNELASAVRRQNLSSWQELRILLTHFYYVDRVYLGPLRTLWGELQSAVVYLT